VFPRSEAIWLLCAALLGCKLGKSNPSSAPSSSAPPASATAATSASAPPAPSASPTATECGKAIACCKLVAARAGYKKQENQCEKFEKYSEVRCKASLGELQQAARVLGLDCKKAWAE
jgi:hypothetical protein